MAQHWSPLSQLQRDVVPYQWVMFDRHRSIAIIRVVEIRGANRKLIRSVTYHPESAQRQLIGYFPNDAVGLRLAAAVTWQEYVRAVGPPTSNRR